MSVPELVMKAFEPLMTHSPPSTGPGLGQTERAQRLARAERRQPLLLLLLGPEPEDRHGAEGDPRLEGDRDRLVDPAELLEDEAEGEVVAAHAAVLLREGQTEQAHLRHLPDDVVREGLRRVVVRCDGRDDVAGEGLDGLAELLLLFTEPGVEQGIPPSAGVEP